MNNYCFGKKIPRSIVEENDELISKILERANSDSSKRRVGERTAIKRYVKYINSKQPEQFAHLYSANDSLYFDHIPISLNKKNSKMTQDELNNSLENVEVVLSKMKDQQFSPELFIPIKSRTPIDKIISNKEGVMPATNTIVLGDPGIGKTTVMLDLLSNIKKNNPEKRCLFVSGEMNRIDLAEYMERLPGADEIDIFFTMDYEENSYLYFQKVLSLGWDIILFDSFDEIKESINEDLGLSSTKAEKWMIDQMVNQNLGKNKKNINTSFLAIQQVTKGGKFVGSNKLKHNTTAMLEIRYDKISKEPKLYYTKNRRGNTDLDLFFSITSEGIQYDSIRFSREVEFKKKIQFDEVEQEKENNKFNEIFNLHEDEDGNFITNDMEEEVENNI